MAELIVLIGAPGSGKSTYAARRWPTTLVLSLDGLRAELTGDEADQSATPAAVARLHQRLHKALAADIDAVVDATNAAAEPDRASLLATAAAHHTTVRADIVATPLHVSLGRNAARSGSAAGQQWGRRVPPATVARMHAAITDLTDAGLLAEGFTTVERVVPTDIQNPRPTRK